MSILAAAARIPAEVQIPTPLMVVLLAGALASAGVAIARFVRHTGLGMSWLRQKVVEPEREDIKRVEAQLREVLAELRSENGGSIREQVNHICVRVDELRDQVYDHVETSTADRAYLHERLDGTIAANELEDPET